MGFPITGSILQQQALKIATSLGKEGFSASEGWLCKWKARYNIKKYNICGESELVDLTVADDWKENLGQMVHGYNLKDVFNMDETGYFFRALPTKSLNKVGQMCKGGKQSKD